MTITVLFDLGPVLTAHWSQLMATLADFTAKLDSLDSKVADIAKEIADLKAAQAAGGLTADEEAQVSARLDALTTALDAAK